VQGPRPGLLPFPAAEGVAELAGPGHGLLPPPAVEVEGSEGAVPSRGGALDPEGAGGHLGAAHLALEDLDPAAAQGRRETVVAGGRVEAAVATHGEAVHVEELLQR
jgi:hypothetical protein